MIPGRLNKLPNAELVRVSERGIAMTHLIDSKRGDLNADEVSQGFIF